MAKAATPKQDAMAFVPQTEMMQRTALHPNERNSRLHDAGQLDQIASSIREFGFTVPILVDEELNVLAGHGRLMAAEMLGLSKVPIIKATHLSDVQKRAYIIADNKITENALWDDSLLAEEISFLSAQGFDLTLTGLEQDEIDMLMPQEEEEEDKAEADEDEEEGENLESFDSYSNTVKTDHKCPRCGFEWVGQKVTRARKAGDEAEPDTKISEPGITGKNKTAKAPRKRSRG